MPVTTDQLKTLTALIDRIIPADDFPSASENGVVEYIRRLLSSELQHRAAEVQSGLVSLNEETKLRFQKSFADLDEALQVGVLRAIEDGQHVLANWKMPPNRFFELMVTLTNEGYYTDPSNGSNLGGVSWRMIGYDPRVPKQHVGEKWLEGLA